MHGAGNVAVGNRAALLVFRLEAAPIADSHANGQRLAFAQHGNRNFFFDRRGAHQIHKVAIVFNASAVELQDDVANVNIGQFRGRTGGNA